MGIAHAKMKILSLVSTFMFFQYYVTVFLQWNTKDVKQNILATLHHTLNVNNDKV